MLGREEAVVEGVEGSSDSDARSYADKKTEATGQTLPTAEVK